MLNFYLDALNSFNRCACQYSLTLLSGIENGQTKKVNFYS